jgi:predicted DNA-binding transcriptional regulator AlpA
VSASIDETAAHDALCVNDAGLAALLDVSVRTVHRLDSRGAIPRALALGRCRRWSVDEIKAWIKAGAPPRRQWIAMREDEA